MEIIVTLGSLHTNRKQLQSIHNFESVPIAYDSLDDAIEAAKNHYRRNYALGQAPHFRVYESTDPDGTIYAIVEVVEGEPADMKFNALYKVIANKYQFDRSSPPVTLGDLASDSGFAQPPR